MSNKESPTSSKNKSKRQRKEKEEGEAKSKKFKGDNLGENENHIEAAVVSDVTWTDEQMKLLLSRIEGQLPKNDSVNYKKSFTTLNWDDVKFDHFTSEQCKAEFISILSKLRKHRTMTEILGDAVKWVDAPKKKTAHPDKPSKPMSSYLIFYMEKRPKLAKKYPDMKLTELTQKIADKFKHLPPEKKQKYIDKAENKREEYQEKLKKFYELHPDQLVAEAALKAKKPNPAGLFRPQPPFKNYCDKKLKEHENDENFDQKAFIAKCKEKWHKMSDKKKFAWIKGTLEKENEFMEKMKVFQATNPEQCTLSDFKSVLSKEEKLLYDKMCGKPEKPPTSAYILFCRDALKSCTAPNQRDKIKECSEKWKSMTHVQKSEFIDRLKHMQTKYEFEYANYLSKLPEEKRRAELETEKAKIKKRVAQTNQKAETMCNALENFIQRTDSLGEKELQEFSDMMERRKQKKASSSEDSDEDEDSDDEDSDDDSEEKEADESDSKESQERKQGGEEETDDSSSDSSSD
ncbi:hypothetical protein LSTR_LSTR012239 [Laodelphax striatellus]|uniref:HMG box domain-containing protein n=1 Tax=Laodelphax striatellus TaxID=195883 RepID=A0A482X8G4_LAOST|nr:hypothetical protein LSTR_LSTR012239 [Laodelphax striatellus]